jgi:hypothetical protein
MAARKRSGKKTKPSTTSSRMRTDAGVISRFRRRIQKQQTKSHQEPSMCYGDLIGRGQMELRTELRAPQPRPRRLAFGDRSRSSSGHSVPLASPTQARTDKWALPVALYGDDDDGRALAQAHAANGTGPLRVTPWSLGASGTVTEKRTRRLKLRRRVRWSNSGKKYTRTCEHRSVPRTMKSPALESLCWYMREIRGAS